MEGWIKLHRKVLDNPIACKDSDHMAVWSYLLLMATHKEYSTLLDGRSIKLEPGQLITGRKVIADKFKISESKVQRILKLFESEQQIEQLTSATSRLISVRSWDEYQTGEQPFEQPVNNYRTTSEQPVNTIQECNNDKNDKKTTSVVSVLPPTVKKSIDERAKEFGEQLKPFTEKYDRPMLVEFYNYWTEHSTNGKKMRFEKEKVFDVSKRLATWKLRLDQRFIKQKRANEYEKGKLVQ